MTHQTLEFKNLNAITDALNDKLVETIAAKHSITGKQAFSGVSISSYAIFEIEVENGTEFPDYEEIKICFTDHLANGRINKGERILVQWACEAVFKDDFFSHTEISQENFEELVKEGVEIFEREMAKIKG